MLINLLKRIDRDRFDCSVFSLIGSGKLTREIQVAGFEATTLSLRYPFQIMKILKLLRMLKRGNFHLIQTYGLRADTMGRILGKAAGIPVIVSSIRSPDPWRKWYHSAIDRLTLPLVDYFISNSEAGRQSRIRREKYPPDLIKVVHNGIELPPSYSENEKKTLRNKFEISEKDNPVIAIVANLRVMKGHRDVIDALPELLKTLPDITFLFAGRDDSSGAIEKYAEQKGVADSIRFPGHVKEPSEILSVSDIYLHPSHWEGCPTALLEAMAAGLPCIACRTGGIPEIIEDEKNGLLIPPKSPTTISDSIRRLCRDEKLRRGLSSNAVASIRDHHSLRQMVKEYENAYQALLYNISQK